MGIAVHSAMLARREGVFYDILLRYKLVKSKVVAQKLICYCMCTIVRFKIKLILNFAADLNVAKEISERVRH